MCKYYDCCLVKIDKILHRFIVWSLLKIFFNSIITIEVIYTNISLQPCTYAKFTVVVIVALPFSMLNACPPFLYA